MTDEAGGDSGEESPPDTVWNPKQRTQQTAAPSSTRRLRGRQLLDRYFLLAVLIAVFAISAGGVLTYTVHIDPGTELEEQVEMQWQESGQFSHETTVVNESEAFELGETLRDRGTYFTRVSPTLDGTYEYEYAAGEGEIDATVRTQLVIRSVSDDEILWERTEELDNQTFEGVQPGETVTASFELDVPAVEQRIQAIEESLGSSTGQTEIRVEGSVVSTGTVEGRSIEADHTNTLSLTPSDSIYGVETDGVYTETHQSSTREPVDRSYGPLTEIAGPLLLLTGLLFGGLFGWLRIRGMIALSATERRTLDHRRKRAKFDDWITTGIERSVITRDTWIETGSLDGLVDIAIDTNNRVIEDPTGSIYYVVDDVVYTYTPDLDSNSKVSLEESPTTDRLAERTTRQAGEIFDLTAEGMGKRAGNTRKNGDGKRTKSVQKMHEGATHSRYRNASKTGDE